MNNLKHSIMDRVLSVMLAMTLLMSVMPFSAFAEEAQQLVYSVNVSCSDGESADGAEIAYSVIVGGVDTLKNNGVVSDGVYEFVGLSDILDNASGSGESVQLKYTISKEGYISVSNVRTISESMNTFEETLVKQETIVPVVHKVTVDVVNSEYGSVKLNNTETKELTVNDGESVDLNVSAKEDTAFKGRYTITSVSIDSVDQKIDNSSEFATTIKNVKNDIAIKVEFDKNYSVKFSFNKRKGTVIYNSDNILTDGDVVAVKKDDKIVFSAVPTVGHRVSKLTINGEETVYTENDKYLSDQTLDANKDYEVAIEFAKNEYTVSIDSIKEYKDGTETNVTDILNVSIKADKDTYEYGGSATITISLNGYDLKDFYVNNVKQEAGSFTELGNGTKTFTVSGNEDVSINVVVVKMPELEFNGISWNRGEAYYNDGNTYVFQKGKEVTFSTEDKNYRGLQIETSDGTYGGRGKTSVTIKVSDKDIEIKKVIVYLWGIFKSDAEISNGANSLPVLSSYKGPDLTLTETNRPENGIYNAESIKDLSVKVEPSVKEGAPEITKLSYKIVVDNEVVTEKTLFPKPENSETETETNNEINSSYTIDKKVFEEINSSNVKLTVTAEDEAGNTTEKELTFDIDKTAPTILVEYDNNDCITHENDENSYFNKKRKATITIKERDNHFDADKATKGIKITATDVNGNVVENAYSISGWDYIEHAEGKTPDDDEHTATITYTADAKYTFNISYTDEAGNKGEEVSDNFTIDMTAPTANISTEKNIWKELLDTITFGIFSNKEELEVTSTYSDNLSGVVEVVYYKDVYGDNDDKFSKYYENNKPTEKLLDALDEIYANNKFVGKIPSFTNGEKAVIYMRVTDKAGNYIYVNTNGVIVENDKPGIDETYNNLNKERMSKESVTFKFTVNDKFKTVNDKFKAYSGIQEISYQVIKGSNIITDKTVLYSYEEGKDLQASKDVSVTLDSEKYNADDLQIKVTAIDNAGNEYNYTTEKFSINTDPVAPRFDYSGTQNNDVKGEYYTARKATLIIPDVRNSFDPDAAKNALAISAVDVNGKAIDKSDLYTIGEWYQKSNGNHCIDIEFNYDGNYTINKYIYTNKAGNQSTIAEQRFTIDSKAPTGSIKIGGSAWDKLLKTITFGIYSRNEMTVSIISQDETTQTSIAYFVTDKTSKLSVSELKKRDSDFKEYKSFKLAKNSKDVVYVKITDQAGNVTYICSDGHVIDDKACDITLNVPNAKNIYNGDITVNYDVKDPDIYSGIKTVTYKVTNNGTVTQEGTLFSFNNSKPSYNELVNEKKGSIKIDSKKNNSSNVVLTVTAVDNANNRNSSTMSFDIDITAPKINVSYNNNNDNNGNSYFDRTRTATIVITERNNHFNADKATNGIKITAKDVNGKNVENAYRISTWTVKEGASPDDSQHTATIRYNADANYTFDISYTDEAGNRNSAVKTDAQAPYKFTVDTTPPQGSISAVSTEGNSITWTRLLNSLSYSFWSNGSVRLTSASSDATSPITAVEYHKMKSSKATDNTYAMTAAELDRVTDWQKFSGLNISANEQFALYLRITDKAGNYTYISSDGIIVDDIAPTENVGSPKITATPQQTKSGIYNSDVKVSIDVEDPLVGGAYSGLRTISYRVLNMGRETQTGTLFTFSGTDPKQSDLVKKWNSVITVDSALNNSNDVVVEVYADDNSRNSSVGRLSLKIDTTAPQIQVSYNNNSASGRYFKDNRTATIVVTERNFDSSEVNVEITNTDGVIPTVGEWSRSGGTGNGDDTRWTASVTFASDGDYTFNVSCADTASNKSGNVQYASGTAAAEDFTIDKTLPVINVAFDNNDSKNGNYYTKQRTATITITEHNFNANNVTVTAVATDDGQSAAAPVIGNWSSNGDVHTATITFKNDGLYTLDIACHDNAMNNAQTFAQQKFYIDNTDPVLTIGGVENKTAYGEGANVIPTITYADTNIDYNSAVIKLSGTNVEVGECKMDADGGSFTLKNQSGDTFEWTFKTENIHNGKSIVFENFPIGEKYKDFDDIYTLSAEITDNSGRKTSRSVAFSVNRFGSSYDIKSLTDMLGKFIKQPTDVVIREINANELSDIVITLFKNGDSIVLEKDKDYSVEIVGDESKWYEYKYTIFADNFNDDGIYSIKVHSVDKAGNESENTLDTKGTEISFGIDKTVPTVVVANLKSGETYAETKKQVIISADDNLKLASVTVYLDDKEFASWDSTSEEISSGKGEFTFEITDSTTKAHNLRVVCLDEAGNETVTEVNDFYVTTNILVRYFNNKPLFIGSIIALILIAALIVFIIIRKRR